ncbi:MAG: hypothetical protein LBG95_01845 [Treponema sp.]|jgi:hypothetical protein|nr:hypothetical protein [Treponema sp.]
MAIQPIDLQILFTQMDKVGKAQSAQREGLALHEAIQGVQIQRKTEEHIQAVNETQNMGEGAEKVKDRGAQGQNSGEGKKKEAHDETSEQDKAQAPVISDPCLGRNIDISL